MTSAALKAYTIVIALICGAALAWSIDQQHLAASTAADARNWQQLAAATVAHDRATTRANRLLVVHYNRLVHRTAIAQRRLLLAIKRARAASVRAAATQSTVYQTVPGSTVSAPPAAAPAASPVAAPAAAPAAPTTRTS